MAKRQMVERIWTHRSRHCPSLIFIILEEPEWDVETASWICDGYYEVPEDIFFMFIPHIKIPPYPVLIELEYKNGAWREQCSWGPAQ